MREIVFDTETTGLSAAEGHRIIEIGAVELLNHLPTGNTFHRYLNPEREIDRDAEAVHGLSTAFLKDKPLFTQVAQDFLDFIGDSTLVIHNAAFDIEFINAELSYVNLPPITFGQVVDTLQMARRKFPMGQNSLDALCRRFGVDTSKRTKHGALLDSELLAEVYLELVGGRQTTLGLADAPTRKVGLDFQPGTPRNHMRSRPLPSRLTEAEQNAHAKLVQSLGAGAVWNQ